MSVCVSCGFVCVWCCLSASVSVCVFVLKSQVTWPPKLVGNNNDCLAGTAVTLSMAVSVSVFGAKS